MKIATKAQRHKETPRDLLLKNPWCLGGKVFMVSGRGQTHHEELVNLRSANGSSR